MIPGSYEALQAPDNLPVRLGVMGSLATLGLIASRGRLVWTAVGAGAGAALCYPQSLQAVKQSAYNGERWRYAVQCVYYYCHFLPGEIPDLPTVDTAQISDFVLKSGEYFNSAITSIKQATKPAIVEDQPKITKESTLVFLKSSELQPVTSSFKGDRGMSREEDKDLYATRG